jgi:hypothetical protein
MNMTRGLKPEELEERKSAPPPRFLWYLCCMGVPESASIATHCCTRSSIAWLARGSYFLTDPAVHHSPHFDSRSVPAFFTGPD